MNVYSLLFLFFPLLFSSPFSISSFFYFSFRLGLGRRARQRPSITGLDSTLRQRMRVCTFHSPTLLQAVDASSRQARRDACTFYAPRMSESSQQPTKADAMLLIFLCTVIAPPRNKWSPSRRHNHLPTLGGLRLHLQKLLLLLDRRTDKVPQHGPPIAVAAGRRCTLPGAGSSASVSGASASSITATITAATRSSIGSSSMDTLEDGKVLPEPLAFAAQQPLLALHCPRPALQPLHSAPRHPLRCCIRSRSGGGQGIGQRV